MTKILMTNGSLLKVESIAECSTWSILQYFWLALSDTWSWKPIFGLFESGRFTRVLLSKDIKKQFRSFSYNSLLLWITILLYIILLDGHFPTIFTKITFL